jgi:hypothetical protein
MWADLTDEVVTTTGLGSMVVLGGATAGRQRFGATLADGAECWTRFQNASGEWEIVAAVYDAGSDALNRSANPVADSGGGHVPLTPGARATLVAPAAWHAAVDSGLTLAGARARIIGQSGLAETENGGVLGIVLDEIPAVGAGVRHVARTLQTYFGGGVAGLDFVLPPVSSGYGSGELVVRDIAGDIARIWTIVGGWSSGDFISGTATSAFGNVLLSGLTASVTGTTYAGRDYLRIEIDAAGYTGSLVAAATLRQMVILEGG